MQQRLTARTRVLQLQQSPQGPWYRRLPKSWWSRCRPPTGARVWIRVFEIRRILLEGLAEDWLDGTGEWTG